MKNLILCPVIGCIILFCGVIGCSRESDPHEVESHAEKTLPPAPMVPTISSELQLLLEVPGALPAPYSAIRKEVLEVVGQLYSQNQYQPVWFQGKTFEQARASEFIDAFAVAKSHGLNPADYFSESLRKLILELEGVAKEDRLRVSALVDWVVTLCVTSLAYDLHLGSVPYQSVTTTWGGVNKEFDAEALFLQIRSGELAEKILESHAPQHEEYQNLRRALATYRQIAESGGWKPIDPSMLNQIEDREFETGSHSLVSLLRERLIREGYQVSQPENAEAEMVYDDSLRDEMKRFQANRGLHDDGIVGPLTVEALNISVEDLIEKIIWSMDRWRWLPEELGGRHILVNIPEFTLRAYEEREEILRMRIIVGDSVKGTYTPLFTDEMDYVIFQPFWNVPRSIIRKELLPEIKKDRGYIRDFNYEIVDRFGPEAEVFEPSRRNVERLEEGELKIRQTAGPYNALGLVKFIFPNRHAVYFHDTNQRNLFVHSKRDFSHGCIRVHEPEKLARYALPDSQWTAEAIHEAMYGEEAERKSIRVTPKIPVYIFYLTAFAKTEVGPVAFFEDLYHYDERMANYVRKPAEVRDPEPGIINAALPDSTGLFRNISAMIHVDKNSNF